LKSLILGQTVFFIACIRHHIITQHQNAAAALLENINAVQHIQGRPNPPFKFFCSMSSFEHSGTTKMTRAGRHDKSGM